MDENEKLRQEIIAGLERVGLEPTAVSRQIGRSKDFIRDFITGRKRSLAQDAAQQIREILNSTEKGAQQDGPSNFRPPPHFIGARDLPVYSAAEGGPGEMVVSTDPVEIVPRPWFMNEVKEGYAVLITGESMVPAFRPGEMAIVNPRLPPTRNQDTIFTAKSDDLGEFRATIKHLLRWSSKAWLVEQYNPPEGQEKEFNLDREIWSGALRVVGKYNR